MMLKTPQTSKEGKLVNKILIAEDVYYPGENKHEEFYISILLNRSSSKVMIMYSTEGGVDIESVAENTPNLIFYEEVNPSIGLMPNQARKVAFNLGLSFSIRSMALSRGSIGDISLFLINSAMPKAS